MPTIPYVSQTWTDGSGGGTPVSAARLTVIESGVHAAHFMPCVRAFHNASQSVTSGTPLALALNSERFDQADNAADAMHDVATNNSRLTAKYAGVYLIIGNILWNTSASSTALDLTIRLNGATTIARFEPVSLDVRAQLVQTIYSMAVNDYVELVASQNTGAGVSIASSGNYSPEFMMARMG